MASLVVRTALLINTARHLTRDTPIDKPSKPENNSQQTSHVATKTLPVPSQHNPVSSSQGGAQQLHYYKQLDKTNREQREISRAFRARL